MTVLTSEPKLETSDQSNLKKDRRRTWTVESYSPGGANVHPIECMVSHWAHPIPQSKRNIDRFSHFCRAHDCDRQKDRPTDRPTDRATLSVTTEKGRTKHRAPNVVEWGEKQERAFTQIKQILSKEPILKMPDLNRTPVRCFKWDFGSLSTPRVWWH